MPSEAVLRLMKKEMDGEVPVFHFTATGVKQILDALPVRATHGVGGDHDIFRFNGREVTVRLDDERFEEENADTDYVNQDGLPTAATPLEVLRKYVIIEADGVADDVERRDVERVLLDAMKADPEQRPHAAQGAGKHRKGKKTRKTKGGKRRKTLRRRK